MDYTRDYPTEYAALFGLSPRTNDESAAAFRARVAHELSDLGHFVYAHEALYHQKESSNPFAHGPVDDGYGAAHVVEVAKIVQGNVEGLLAQATRRTWPWYRRLLFTMLKG